MKDKFPPGEPPSSRRTLTFDDNRLIISVFGQHDRNLARLEQQLAVTLINRGNKVMIEGPAGRCESAAQVLEELYDMARQGRHIEIGDVDGTVRMVQSSSVGVSVDQSLDPTAGVVPAETEAGGTKKIAIKTRKKTILPRSPGQADYMRKLAEHDMVFGIGPAGTGKTYLAVAMAVAKMLSGDVDKIILSRPAVEAGENLGFLPGDLSEKIAPYLRPLYDALDDMMPAEQVEKRIGNGQIEIAPLAYMRGRTLSNAFVILDEAQNTTKMQMKMFLTRFGENCRMAICGDPSQVDLPRGTASGLAHALGLLSRFDEIGMTYFASTDVVRHPLVGKIADAYDSETASTGPTLRPKSED